MHKQTNTQTCLPRATGEEPRRGKRCRGAAAKYGATKTSESKLTSRRGPAEGEGLRIRQREPIGGRPW